MVIQSAPAYRARTQHVESVQKATKAGTIREMFRFESDEKVACTGNCPGIGQLEGCTRLPILPAVFLVCCVAFGSALCACIDRGRRLHSDD